MLYEKRLYMRVNLLHVRLRPKEYKVQSTCQLATSLHHGTYSNDSMIVVMPFTLPKTSPERVHESNQIVQGVFEIAFGLDVLMNIIEFSNEFAVKIITDQVKLRLRGGFRQ